MKTIETSEFSDYTDEEIRLGYKSSGLLRSHMCAQLIRLDKDPAFLRDNETPNIYTKFIKPIGEACSHDILYQDELKKEIDGQIAEAMTNPEYFRKWGAHYLKSLARAHLRQECINFKDFALQKYGGKLIKNKRDELEEIFIKMPPPTPSVNPGRSLSRTRGGYQQSTVSAPVDMSRYMNRGGGCFGEDCEVLMGDNSMKKVKDILPGDLVSLSPNNSNNGVSNSTTVKYVVRFKPSNLDREMVHTKNGLIISKWHPVYYYARMKWMRPKDLPDKEIKYYLGEYIYNFVLETGHIVNINQMDCITLGHGYTHDPTLLHKYLSTEEVVNDIDALPQDEQGKRIVTNIVRCPATNYIQKFT